MESWPGDLVLRYGATTTLINLQGEVPFLEAWLFAASDTAARALADRLADAQNLHSRSTESETSLTIDPMEAQAIYDALEANREDLDSHAGLMNLWNTLATVES
jgi:hypothetical protein